MQQQYQHITSKIQNYSLIITLNRVDKKNALDPIMIKNIQSILDTNKNNHNIRVVVIESSSDVFCAGADIEYLNKMRNFSYEDNLNDSKQLMLLFKTILSYPKLIISKVSGAALGGGCGIVTASDIVFSTQKSSFGYPEVKIGFTPALVSAFLIGKINLSKTRELLLSGKIINAEKAQKIGLINFIHTEAQLNKEMDIFIKKIITKTSPDSIHATKQILYTQLDIDNKLERAAEFNAKSRMSNDFKKGIQLFLEKKPHNWI
jgi:methylglutaconyl-CoA hydratase